MADGDVCDTETLTAWIGDLLEHGSIRTDLMLSACAARALIAEGGEGSESFAEVAELALALAPSRERHLETCQQGRSFIETLRATWPSPLLDRLCAAFPEIAYPVAFGAALTAHGLVLRPSLEAFALQYAGNLVSAVVRLGTIGQTQGQAVIAALAPHAKRAAGRALRASLDDIGTGAFRSDLASIRHETKYTRLFRS